MHLPPECAPVILNYAYMGEPIKFCSVRRNFGDTGESSAIYWLMPTCNNWADSKDFCAKGNGQLASFPSFFDKSFLFNSYANLALTGPETWKCSTYTYWMGAVWVGLSRTSSSSDAWNWEDGTQEDDHEIPWNDKAALYGGGDRIGTGNCGIASHSNYVDSTSYSAQGFYRADCSHASPAVCLKFISLNTTSE